MSVSFADENAHDAMTGTAVWRVGCHLGFDVLDEATVVLQIAPAAGTTTLLSEELEVAVDGRPLPVTCVTGEHGGIVHVVRSPPGDLTVDMDSIVQRNETVEPPASVGLDLEQLTYLRQSRYCPSDQLAGFAIQELGPLEPGPATLLAVGRWVADRLIYEEGSSGPLDTALDSLLAGRGVCRDFSHVAITLLRAFGVPARMVAVYAPGLSPMEFHAVVEAHADGRWWVLDPTRLAPRQSLLRVSTGRDAADTAFITVLGGDLRLRFTEVVAVTDSDLPIDDHSTLATLA